jgi:hypothetical protein
MTVNERYAITLPTKRGRGPHMPATVLTVHRSDLRGPDNRPVYIDSTGRFRVLISGQIAEPVGNTDAHGHPCLHAVPLP